MSEERAASVSLEELEDSSAKEDEFSIEDYADRVLEVILDKHPDVAIVISSRDGKCLTASISKTQALETSSCVLSFTDKVKYLVRKILGEELEFVSIKTRLDEVFVTFEEFLEIITIRKDDPLVNR